MGGVLSIDLACCTKNLGICLLTTDKNSYSAQFLHSSDINIADPLHALDFAKLVSAFCQEKGIKILLIDGPQAWKDPDSKLVHCRACEKELATPAKTGVQGMVKPHTWTRFVSFSIEVFNFLVANFGARLAESGRIAVPDSSFLALESFPTSAWRALGLSPLPSKRKCKPAGIIDRAARLRQIYDLTLSSDPSHDELQALVAALAGPPILNGDSSGYRVHGAAPTMKDGIRVEGYIVNPTRVLA